MKLNSLRIDHQFSQFISHREIQNRGADSFVKDARTVRNAAFCMAVAYKEMCATDHVALVALIKSEKKYATNDNPVDAWLSDSFAAFNHVSLAMRNGEDHHKLLQAVHAGMTRKQFVSKGPRLFLSDQKVKKAEEVVNADHPTDGMTPEQQVAYWKAKYAGAMRLVHEYKRKLELVAT